MRHPTQMFSLIKLGQLSNLIINQDSAQQTFPAIDKNPCLSVEFTGDVFLHRKPQLTTFLTRNYYLSRVGFPYIGSIAGIQQLYDDLFIGLLGDFLATTR